MKQIPLTKGKFALVAYDLVAIKEHGQFGRINGVVITTTKQDRE